LRDLRGGLVSMIFQEPMTALDPVYTIGQQIGEIVRRHTGIGRAARARQPARYAVPVVGLPLRAALRQADAGADGRLPCRTRGPLGRGRRRG
jgi:ABC-type microcin C transport system duplicated ATPase subunit YejF